MEKSFYKLYSLEAELKHYMSIDGFISEVDNLNEEQIYTVIDLEAEDEEVDAQTKKDFLDDIYGGMDIPENEAVDGLAKRIRRYQKIVNYLKQKYGFKCQLCGENFLMENGKYYCEAHHIKMLSKDGSQNPDNVIILCANHHRQFHYATQVINIGGLINNKRLICVADKKYLVDFDKI